MFFFQRQRDLAQRRSIGILFGKAAKPPDRLLRFLTKKAAIVPIGKLLRKGRRVGHCKIDPRPQRLAAMAHRTPIGHDDAFKPQRAAQDPAQKMLVFRSQDAVYRVVAAHHRPRLCLQGDLKCAAVCLAQGTLVQFTALEKAVVFAVVRCKVFERCADALALHAFDIRLCKRTSKHAVFGKILKVAPAQGRAFEIDAGAEDHGDIVCDAVLRQSLPHPIDEACIERIAQRGQGGIAR